MSNSNRGLSNQQAILVLIICFPLALIGIGLAVILLQRPNPELVQAPLQPPVKTPHSNGTTIKPLPRVQPPDPKPLDLQQPGISEAEARGIVERWLTVKSQIFAPPYDTNIADNVVAEGPLWTDITKAGGSIDWLRNNNSYYTYSTIRLNNVISYSPSATMPTLVVSVTEDSTLHSPAGSKPSSSTRNWIYTLKEEGGAWKIWDYRKQ
jgi:hypothetical protein